MQLTDKKLLLIDGFGAVSSAILLGYVLVKFQEYFGMPQETLYLLATVALGFATFSITSGLIVKGAYKRHLKIIAALNLAYCCLTLSLVIFYFSELSLPAITYFVGEILLVLSLAYTEFSRSK